MAHRASASLRSIILPLLAPGLVATALFTFISSWNEFFFALVLIQSPERETLPLTLANFVGAEGQVALQPSSPPPRCWRRSRASHSSPSSNAGWCPDC